MFVIYAPQKSTIFYTTLIWQLLIEELNLLQTALINLQCSWTLDDLLKVISCIICNIEFPGAYQFYYHNSKVHSEVHKCDVCGQEFKGREKLKVHKINKHLEDHQKPYVCSLCGKGYAHKTKLQSHQVSKIISNFDFGRV